MSFNPRHRRQGKNPPAKEETKTQVPTETREAKHLRRLEARINKLRAAAQKAEEDEQKDEIYGPNWRKRLPDWAIQYEAEEAAKFKAFTPVEEPSEEEELYVSNKELKRRRSRKPKHP